VSNYISREDAAKLAKKAPQRGYMPPASEIEISLPDIAGTYADIQRHRVVPFQLRMDYLTARSRAFAYGEPHRQEAEDLLDEVLGALRRANLDGRKANGIRG
jgi:hypothetical protein